MCCIVQLTIACEVQLPTAGLEEVVRQRKQKIYKLVRDILLLLREADAKVAMCLWVLGIK